MNKQDELMMDLDLISIQNILADIGLTSELLQKSDVVKLSTLIAGIDPDEVNRQRRITLNFIPLPEDIFEDIKMLQFYMELPFKSTGTTGSSLEALFNFLNINSPLGSFGISDDGKIILKYVHTLSKFENLTETRIVLIEILKFFIFTVDTYSDSIELVAAGIKPAGDVLEELRKML